MTTSFLRELRHNLPHAWITLIVKPAAYDLVELCPYVNELYTFDWEVKGPFPNLELHGRALWLALRHLWRKRFDLAIIPRWDTDGYHASFLAYFSSAIWRVSYSEKVNSIKKRLNRGFDRLFTHIIKGENIKHEVVHNLNVLRFLGGQVEEEHLEIWINDEDKAYATELLKSQRCNQDDLLIAFGPGKRDPKRIWPLSRFAELGSWLSKKYDSRIIILGGKEDTSLGRQLQRMIGDAAINIAGQTTLRQTCALLKQCHIFIGNDSGPKHMAAAVGIPVIEINGHPLCGPTSHPDSPNRFGPWGIPHQVIQPKSAIPPCSDVCSATEPRCILGVTVDQVKEAVTNFFP